MTVTLILEELISDFTSEDKEVMGLKFRSDQGFVTFWGEFGAPNRNISALRNQKLPMMIDLHNPEFCIPSDFDRRKNGLKWSVPSNETFYTHNES